MRMIASRLLAGASAVCLAAVLGGCGGGGSDSSGSATLRVVNASPSYGTLDFYVDDSVLLSGVASGTASGYASVDAGTALATSFTRAGSATPLTETDRTLSGDTPYTVIAYGWEGALRTFQVAETESAPDSGKAKIRTINLAPDAGALDVYVTGVTDALSDVSPVNAGVSGGSLSSFSTLTQGTYRIRVTAAGDKSDVRLDMPSVTLASGEIASLVIEPTSGGVLVNALVLEQQGAVTAFSNRYGRARLVAAVSGNAGVAASLGGTTLSSGSRSPLVGNYVLVPTGELELDASVNGSAVASSNVSVTPGADLTLLVSGDPGAAQTTVLADDNRLPSVPTGSSTKARIRLVNAVSGLGAGLSLVVDYSALADDLAFDTASSYVTLGSGSLGEIDVTSPLQTAALYSATDVTLASDGVYTVFLMGGATSAAGTLRRDR